MKGKFKGTEPLYFPDLGKWVQPGEEIELPEDFASELFEVGTKSAKHTTVGGDD